MTIDFEQEINEQTGIGIGPEGDLIGFLSANGLPWDETVNVPLDSIYLDQNTNKFWRKTGTGDTSGNWTEGLAANIQGTITVADSGTTVETGPVMLDFLNSIQATTPASGEVDVKLVGDAEAPGNDKLYGTNDSGTKGWYDRVTDDDLDDYVEKAGNSPGGDMTGTLQVQDQVTIKHATLSSLDVIFQANAGASPFGASISKSGTSGFLHMMPNAPTVQWIIADPTSATGVNQFFWDVDNAGTMFLNVLGGGGEGGDVVASCDAALRPYVDAGNPTSSTLGTASFRWETIYAQDGDYSGNIVITGTVDGVDVGSPKNSIEVDTNQYQLVGDTAAPGNNKSYGTNASGVKGWYDAGSTGVNLEENGTPVANTPHITLNFSTDFTVTDVDGDEATIDLDIDNGAASGRLNSWTLDSGDKYFQDFAHNLDTTEITYLLRDFSSDEEVRPWDFKVLDADTVRVWVEGN